MDDPSVERRALRLFQRLLDIPEAQRDAWIHDHAAGDDRLISRLNAMRAADRLAAMRTGGAAASLEEEIPPERVGAYRITGLIGRGGMGSVYHGERATGDFKHQVAIKLIKPGLLSDALVARFQRERQTLAGLKHPHIAQLHDGGATEAGSPYIVMELVDGLPLLQFAEARGLARPARLALFRDICDAVAFAHRNLVVHRDLTPSNVLVTREGIAKLIDFGIAKPADLDGDEDGGPSSIVSLSLTPGYAAPERMTGARATTATDVYSLGKVLERLVPPGPQDDELAATIARATAAVPADRYPTVEALTDDIAALQTGAPVTAMGDSRAYRLRKFARRHRLPVAAGGIALTALIVALTISIVSLQRTRAARDAETARFEQLRALAGYMIFDLNDQLERVVGNAKARADLAKRAQTYLTSLAAAKDAPPDLKLDAARGLIKLARIQGVPSEPNLGQRKAARANLQRAEELLQNLPDAGATLAEARARHSVLLLHGEGDTPAAERLLKAAQSALPPPSATPAWIEARRALRKAELEHADLSDRAADLPKLADALEADIARWPADTRNSTAANLDRAYVAYYRALAKLIAGDDKAGLPLFAETQRRFDALVAAHPDDPLILYMSAYTNLTGFSLASRVGAEDLSRRLITNARDRIAAVQRLEPNDDAVVAVAANIKEGLAQDLRDHDQFAEAVALQKEVVADRRRSVRISPSPRTQGQLGFSLGIQGVIAKNAGNRALTCTSWIEAAQIMGPLNERKQLLGFYASLLPGLRANVARCTGGEPITAFKPLR